MYFCYPKKKILRDRLEADVADLMRKEKRKRTLQKSKEMITIEDEENVSEITVKNSTKTSDSGEAVTVEKNNCGFY
jgi:hypothetical protein